VPAYYW